MSNIVRKNNLEFLNTLINSDWDFGRLDGSFIAHLKLLPNGEILGSQDSNESRWKIEENKLVFYNDRGVASTCFTFCEQQEDRFFLTGDFLLHKGIVHTLKQSIVKQSGIISEEELTNTKWDFGRIDGSLISQFRLLPKGKIKGYSHGNEASWDLVDGTLTFYNKKGKPSTCFTSCLKDNGKYFLTGRFLLSNQEIFHVLLSPGAFELKADLPAKFYIDLGNAFQEQERWEEAIACYQKVIKLHPEKDRAYRALGQAYMGKRDWEEAIASYQKAIKLNPEQPPWLYQRMGNAFQELQRYKKAIGFYQKGLKIKQINPYVRGQIYHNLYNAQLQIGQQEQATISLKKALEPHYLVSHKHQLIYCNISKNATQLFRTMIVEHSDDKDKFHQFIKQSNSTVNEYLLRNDTGVRITDYSYLNAPEYFKFVILRNPFERLVSAYIDKFVKNEMPQPFAHPVIKDVHRYLGIEPDLRKGITFNHFIKYLATTKNDMYLDTHWRPQHSFLGLGLFKKFDFIGQFENLDLVIEYLENKFGFKIQTQNVSHSKHITRYGNMNANEKFHNLYPEQLRTLDGFPKARQLYSPQLEELVRKRYAEDIAIYEQEFNVTLAVN